MAAASSLNVGVPRSGIESHPPQLLSTKLRVTRRNIIKKSERCFIQPVTANQVERSA